MKRPTFFISSTIYDFKDLRSALKFYLEDQGYKVLASEFNDFTKSVDKHSYDACLSAIRSADYFILLIGDRIGGWYDETARISITQREYREAYELHCAGKLKILNFVRASVWQVREDRRELAKYLKSLPIDIVLQKDISNYPSKFASDAKFLSDFIAEISRSHETKLSVQGEGPTPTGNWVHVVNGFKDIIDVLEGQLLSLIPVEEITQKRLLRRELRDFVSQALFKSKAGAVHSPRAAIDLFHEEHPIIIKPKLKTFTTVAVKRWNMISLLSFHLSPLQFHPVVLPHAISRATFLEFDLTTDSYKETIVYEAFLQLQNEIRKFNRLNTKDTLSIVYEHLPKNGALKREFIDIETMKLVLLLSLFDRWVNILELSRSLLRYLDGNPFEMTSLRPDSPIHGMSEELNAERPTGAEIDKYLYEGNKGTG